MPSYKRYYQKNKFGAKKTEFMGMKFDSKWEAERYGQLCKLQEAGEISGLDRQVRFNIVINDQKICAYIGPGKIIYNIACLQGSVLRCQNNH